MDTPANTFVIVIIIPYGRINSRMTSYLKFSVLIDFRLQDAIFPFNRSLCVVRSGAPRHDVARAHGGGPARGEGQRWRLQQVGV